ncbi:MAG TPA: AsmA-like C-terminal region-containing protein, partial [Christiangramia sp.]|nr:AsmA-like C-terminal region-containing protein [Christiangramia sp.]
PPFEKENFIKASELSLSIDVFKLITSGRIDIDGIYLINSRLNVQIDQNGRPNYNVFVQQANMQKAKDSVDEEEVHLNLDIVVIEDAGVVYDDRSLNLKLKASNFNYKGKGNYIESDVELESLIKIGSVDFELESTQYLTNKSIEADLYTKYNSNSLSIAFEENDLTINNLDISFKGYVELLKDGYNVDLDLTSTDSRLEDLFTALPPSYVSWKDNTEIQGNMNAFLKFKGSYIEAQKKKPDIFLDVKIDNASISYQEAPIPIREFYLDLKTRLPNSDINLARIDADTISFKLNNDYVFGKMTTEGGPDNMNLDGKITANIDLDDLVRAIGIKDYELGGKLISRINLNGTYNPETRLFPKIDADIDLKNGLLVTPYYPNAIENIDLSMKVFNNDGTNQGTKINISEGNFKFEEEDFSLIAQLENLDDLKYDVKANGVLHISNIYKVFAVEDLEVDGKIAADLRLQGTQSDATNGNYEKLNNSGTLYLQNIATRSSMLPKPFIIREGKFQFHQDEMAFSGFQGEYASSKMNMNGYLKNVINYVLSENEVLQGKFSLESEKINSNEFMPKGAAKTDSVIESDIEVAKAKIDTTSASEGIVQVPTDLDLVLDLNVKSLLYDELEVKNLSGILAIKDGGLVLKNGNLELVGARAQMDGLYKNEGIEKAFFSYQLAIADFDVQKAYKELEIFRVMAPAAENAEGIISVDYKITGVLDSEMQPVLESLEGSGKLSIKQVKLKGHKMMGSVSSKTQREQLSNPDLSEVEINSSLKNNILNIEQFKFKVKPFKLKMEGQTSLTGDLNLKMRIGLPPFGIIGIPIKVTGKSENPNVELGKKSKDLEESLAEDESYSDLEKAKITALKDSINDDMSMDEIEALQAKLDDMPEEAFFPTNDSIPADTRLAKEDSLKVISKERSIRSVVKQDTIN